MNKPVTIVVLGKYKDVFGPFADSVSKFCPGTPVVFVRDGNEIDSPEGWNTLQGPEKFSMAGNGNIGLRAVPPDHDILYCGDDVRFIASKTIENLQEDAYSDEKIGILSPRLIGRGSPALCNPKPGVHEVRPLEMWFPCVYIKREVIDKVGYLDELFNDFGSDDLDFCIRTRLEGYKLSVTSRVSVVHKSSPEGGPTTFVKNIGVEKYLEQQDMACDKLRSKWSLSPDAFQKFMATGDVQFLKKSSESSVTFTPDPEERLLCTKDQVKDFLKTRYLHLAAPAYGGWLSVNFVNSVIRLERICMDLGIMHNIAFVYNESLITRARNTMVHDFLKGQGTDFFFVDADIGFHAEDLVMLMLHPEDIVGCPCVRKNLRLDRVANAVKKNGREYSIPELHALTGEYVVNFLPGPTLNMNLGRLWEVKDVGTGIMRVRREAFEKIMEFDKSRYYLPMHGEANADRVPMYMFFQAEIDEETRATNPGQIPDYIPEDYAFCRLARRAGLKVWLAPWMKSSHMGSLMFQGDLKAVADAGGTIR